LQGEIKKEELGQNGIPKVVFPKKIERLKKVEVKTLQEVRKYKYGTKIEELVE